MKENNRIRPVSELDGIDSRTAYLGLRTLMEEKLLNIIDQRVADLEARNEDMPDDEGEFWNDLMEVFLKNRPI